MNKGKALRAGDTIGVVATSSPATEEVLNKAMAELQGLGYKVKISDTCRESYGGYLAGTPEQRAAELNAMFVDEEVDGIMCMRGGYGSPQILPLLDYDLIAQNPKLFIGYSDITALHTVFGQRSNLATLHGPMATSDIAHGLDDWSKQYLLRAMTRPEPLGAIMNPPGKKSSVS